MWGFKVRTCVIERVAAVVVDGILPDYEREDCNGDDEGEA